MRKLILIQLYKTINKKLLSQRLKPLTETNQNQLKLLKYKII